MNSQDFRNLQEAYLDVYGQEEIMEGMTIKDFKANRRTIKRREDSADAERRGHVSRTNWEAVPTTYSPDEAQRRRKNMSNDERSERRRAAENPDDGDSESYSADKTKNIKKLRKQKAMGELKDSFDLYDIILSHLIDEGYADTEDSALVIMANMSEDWRESITEAYKKLPLGKMMKKVQKRATREADTRAEIEYDPTFPTMKALKADEKASRENKRSDTMINVADTHNEKQAKRKEDDNRREGGRKREAGRPRRNELQDNW